MPVRIEAEINPKLLMWARNSIRLSIDDLAKKINTSIKKVEEWESGINKPTVTQLRNIAKVLKRPIAIFYLPEPPKTFDAMKDFRKIADFEHITHQSSIFIEIRRAHYKRDVALELIQEMGEKYSLFKESIIFSNNYEIIAKEIRATLTIPFETQKKWKDIYIAFNSWKDAIEKKGILVFQTSHTSRINIEEMRGFSISEEILPVIVINSKDSMHGKIFTLIHEYVHLLLHNSGICDLMNYDSPQTEEQKIETFCNRVAGGILVPDVNILNEEIVIKQNSKETWSLDDLSILSKIYSVSQEVILRRLLILNRTTQNFYENRRKEYIKYYKKLAEEKSENIPPYFRLVIRNNGVSFVKLVLEAYHQEVINSSQLSDFLGMKLKHLEKIESSIYGYAI